jgi:hypothetical protein
MSGVSLGVVPERQRGADGMGFIRRSVLGAAAGISVLALGAPMAGAQIFPVGNLSTITIGQANAPTGCAANSPAGVGFAGGTTANSCGTVLTFTSPAIGLVAGVAGPTLIGATVLAPVVTTAGPAGHIF